MKEDDLRDVLKDEDEAEVTEPEIRIVYRDPPKTAVDEIIEDQDSRAWLVTFADLMMLILVFFVLLYSMSSLKVERFEAALRSIQASLGSPDVVYVVREVVKEVEIESPPQTIEEATGIAPREEKVVQEIERIIQDQDISEYVDVYRQGEKIIIQIRGTALFSSSEAQLNITAQPVFDEVMKVFERYPEYSINIRGHTDNLPIRSRRYPSNWELSTARAASVLRWFVERGIPPERMTASGYADYAPIAPNDSPENRAINRRVEFVLEKEVLY
jgi:chemotaxis protein MotB